MRTLKALFFIWMFGFSLGARAAEKPETAIHCEFFLTDPRDISAITKWIIDAISPMEGSEPLFLGNYPRPAAFRALGLPSPFPSRASMRIEPASLAKELYWMKFFMKDGSELARIPFHFPPVVVWKRVEGWGDQRELELVLPITREDAGVITAGTLVGEFDGGRRVVFIRRRLGSFVTVGIGIDVPLDKFRAYSNAPDPMVVAVDEHKLLARIEVVKAHFTISSRRGKEDRLQ